MLKFNRATLRDKIYACWLGKNIGGTIGAPYEGGREMNDIQGFVTKPGEVLPNDDLDLQLIWLKAMEERGPEGVNAQVLGEYWLSYIQPNWNEYGVCKSNLRAGIPAPMSGEYNNGRWRHSNGAWIRTEIWACLYPGHVEKAIEYSFADASVDHGFGEGSYAAIFVAAMESAAFLFNDLEVLIRIGLSKIPEDCRTARSVRIALDAYHSGKTWQEARTLLVEDSADLGWFQAPANVAFAIVGLLYGEGDFKKSMIIAVNCGDDTDCTAATLGSIMGIMGGTAALPQDWVSYLGDNIVQKCLLNGHCTYPETITKLTDIIMDMLPVTMHHVMSNEWRDTRFEWTVHDDADDFGGRKPEDYYGTAFVDRNFGHGNYCITAKGTFVDVRLEMDNAPEITPEGTLGVRVKVTDRSSICQQHCHINWYLPEGWKVSGKKDLHMMFNDHYVNACNAAEYVITAGENVAASNHVVMEVQLVGRTESIFASFNILS